MNSLEAAAQRRQDILEQIADLGPMRMGSVTQQSSPFTRKDGSIGQRRTRFTYTFKRKNKTLGKHIGSEREARIYREQIETFRRYQALSAELLTVSQQLADLTNQEQCGKKNFSARSNSNNKSRRKKSSKP